MSGYITNIERDTLANEDFRRVLFTGPNMHTRCHSYGVYATVWNLRDPRPVRMIPRSSPGESSCGC